MKIEFIFDSKGPIKLLKEIPDAQRLKLLGYNGIGKTLTANVLASISGQVAWIKNEQIKSLSQFLPEFIVKIDINGKKYKIESDVNKWELDPITSALRASSIGKISLNGSIITAEEFWKDFKCYIIRGNEDINSQIEFMASCLERAILFNIRKIEGKEKEFSKTFDELCKFLSQEGLSSSILSEESEIEELESPVQLEEHIVEVIEKLVGDLKKTKNLQWISIISPRESFNNLLKYNAQIKKQLESCKNKLDTLKNKIPTDEENRLLELRKQIKEFETKISSINLPLSEEEYPSPETSRQGKILLMERIDEILKTIQGYKEDHFREDFWQSSIKHLYHLLTDYELSEETNILLSSKNRSSISVNELDGWQASSAKISKSELVKLGDYQKFEDEKRELINKADKFDEHEKKLKEISELKTKLSLIMKKFEEICSSLTELKELPEIENSFTSLTNDSNAFDFIITNLEELSQFEKWSDIFGLEVEIESNESIMEELAKISELHNEVVSKRKKIITKKKLYIKNLIEQSSMLKIPDKLKKLIQEKDILTLCELADVLSSKDLNITKFLREDLKDAIRSILDKIENKSEQSKFISEANLFIGGKIKELLNQPAFRKHVFSGNEVLSVNPQKNILTYRDDEKNVFEKFIADYSTGQKAFAYSMASIFYAVEMGSSTTNNLLILDEFGAMLAEDKENFLYDYLDKLQARSTWLTQYIVVLPYKGEFDREEYKKKLGGEVALLKKQLLQRGYAFDKL